MDILRVRVDYRPVYRCVDCNRQALGDAVVVETDTLDIPRSAFTGRPSGMPVGWASYGIGTYRCPDHAI